MNDINFDEAGMLLQVIKLAGEIGQPANAIAAEAGLRIAEINAECLDNAIERRVESDANDTAHEERQAALREAQGDALNGPQPEDPNAVLEDHELKSAPITTTTLRRP